jgi:arylsulfatase A-like enzyme
VAGEIGTIPKHQNPNEFPMPSRRPNVLFITCDQWRGDSLSAAGHPVVKTPNADALAAEGTMFLSHYAGAAPCSPARACIYTGLYQMTNRVGRNGTPMDGRFWNMARGARAAGYDPTLFGYTDVSPDPRLHYKADPVLKTYEGVLPGFTTRLLLTEHQKPWLSWLAARGHDVGAGFPDIHRPRSRQVDRVSTEPPVYSRDETLSAFLAGEFIRWLGEQDAPWFAHVSFLSPHPPFMVPEPFNTMYSPDDGPDLARRGSVEEEAALHTYVAWELSRQKRSSFLPGHRGRVADWTEKDFRQIRALYWGMVSEVDSQLGRIWRALRAAGAWDDTLIVLTSDHAEMLGDHFALGKGGFFGGSYHIPLIIREPGASGGQRVDRFTEAVDLLPTVIDMIGAPPMPHLDGRSLRPWVRGETPATWRGSAHWEFDFRTIAKQKAEAHFGLESRRCNLAVLRGERFKYVHFVGLPPLLFDLAEDPGETRDLSNDPAYRDARLDCAEEMLAWRAEHLDQSLALAELTDDGIAGFFAPRVPA